MNNDMLTKMHKLMSEKGVTGKVTAEEIVSANKASESIYTDAHFEPIIPTTIADRFGIKQITHNITLDGFAYDIFIRTAINKYGRTEMNGTITVTKHNSIITHPFVWDASEFNQVFLNSYQENSLSCKKFKAECMKRSVDFNIVKNKAITDITAIVRTTFNELGIDMLEWLGNKSNDIENSGFDIMGLFSGNNQAPVQTGNPFKQQTSTPIQESETPKDISDIQKENYELRERLDKVLAQVEELTSIIATLSSATNETVNTTKEPKVTKSTKSTKATNDLGYTPFVPSSKSKKGKRLEDIDWDN